jgi:dihydroxyacetone kinase
MFLAGVKDGEEIAILVNGFGGTPLQELYLFNNAVTRELAIIFSRLIPGSPWIPTPYSISSSASVKVGDPLAGTGEEIAILVNGFGGTPLQELYLFNNAVTRELAARNINTCHIVTDEYSINFNVSCS